MLAVLISPEGRSRKPYALPVQLIPYTGLGQKKIRVIINAVIKEMVDRKMDISGKNMYILSYIHVIIKDVYLFTVCV